MSTSTEVNGVPAICTTEISRFMGIGLSADFIINELGVDPLLQTKTGTFWKKSDLRYMCYQLMQYFAGVEQDINSGDIDVT